MQQTTAEEHRQSNGTSRREEIRRVRVVLPFLAVHRDVQHCFPGEQAEQFEDLLLPGDQPFLVSL